MMKLKCRSIALLAFAWITGAFAQPGPVHTVPGVIIDYSPASTRVYIGSPSIALLPDGAYAASHDFFGPGSTRDRTRVFRSTDKGKTWEKAADLEGQWWSTLFFHNGALYIMGTSRQDGFAVIRRSTDGGFTWSVPRDGDSGLLHGDGAYHCAPVPVLVHEGRIWRAMEFVAPPGTWGSSFRSFVMSAPADADLLKASNWLSTNRLAYRPDWPGSAWLEGNIVAGPDGSLTNILRVHHPEGGKAALIAISDDGRTASFDPRTGFTGFPGGSKKFTIRHDRKTDLYWTLSNWIPGRYEGVRPDRTRNTLALASSPDLRHWTVKSVILRHPDVEKTGFQYVDWLFEGNDLIAVVRTAFDDGIGGANNCHDANYMTFHRIGNFRTRTMSDPVHE